MDQHPCDWQWGSNCSYKMLDVPPCSNWFCHLQMLLLPKGIKLRLQHFYKLFFHSSWLMPNNCPRASTCWKRRICAGRKICLVLGSLWAETHQSDTALEKPFKVNKLTTRHTQDLHFQHRISLPTEYNLHIWEKKKSSELHVKILTLREMRNVILILCWFVSRNFLWNVTKFKCEGQRAEWIHIFCL